MTFAPRKTCVWHTATSVSSLSRSQRCALYTLFLNCASVLYNFNYKVFIKFFLGRGEWMATSNPLRRDSHEPKKVRSQVNDSRRTLLFHYVVSLTEFHQSGYKTFYNPSDYSTILATLPDPTVLPPSRIAKFKPCSIAMGWMSSMLISMLSPGMHISVPSGRLQTPVTSVVLK